MGTVLCMGWDATNGVCRPMLVNAAGELIIDPSSSGGPGAAS